MELLNSKRGDIAIRPGFQRHLQALDTSLQRVNASSTKKDSSTAGAATRSNAWLAVDRAGKAVHGDDPEEDEAVLSHTFLNARPASSQTIAAAQSASLAASLKRATASAPVKHPRRITWVDDVHRQGTKQQHVPISPFTNKPDLERPPTPSYSSLVPGPGWVDTMAARARTVLAGRDGAGAARPVLASACPTSPTKVEGAPLRSVLKFGTAWHVQQQRQQQERAQATKAASATIAKAGAPPGSGGWSTPVSIAESMDLNDSSAEDLHCLSPVQPPGQGPSPRHNELRAALPPRPLSASAKLNPGTSVTVASSSSAASVISSSTSSSPSLQAAAAGTTSAQPRLSSVVSVPASDSASPAPGAQRGNRLSLDTTKLGTAHSDRVSLHGQLSPMIHGKASTGPASSSSGNGSSSGSVTRSGSG